MQPTVTRALVGSLVVAWLAQLLYGDSPLAAIRLGANAPALVDAGQFDRLVTANWLHGGWAHVAINGLNLFYLGSVLEQLLGGRRLLAIYLGSCLAGATGSYLMRIGILSVGASTGVAGLFAALGWLLLRHRTRLPPRLRQAWRTWLTLLALQVGLEVWTSSPLNPFPGLKIDHAAHAAGFAAGFSLAATLTARWPPLVTSAKYARYLTVPLAFLLALIVAGIGVSAVRAFSHEPETLRVMAQAALDRDIDPWFQNAYAWDIAIAPEADRATLEVAQSLAERAVAAHGEKNEVESDTDRQAWWFERSNIVDTLATVYFRLGRFDRALTTELDARRSPESLGPELNEAIDSQLARFIVAYREAHQSPLQLSGSTAELTLTLDSRDNQTLLYVDAANPTRQTLTILAAAVDGDGAPAGLFRIRTNLSSPARTELVADTDHPIEQTRVGLIRVSETREEARVHTVEWMPMNPTVASYPNPLPETHRRSEPSDHR